MGIPLFLTAFGDDGALPAIIATLAGKFILIGGAIAVLEKLRAKGPSTLDICREVGGTLIRNPLLVAPILGILFSVSRCPCRCQSATSSISWRPPPDLRR